jgi:hypothetical protein
MESAPPVSPASEGVNQTLEFLLRHYLRRRQLRHLLIEPGAPYAMTPLILDRQPDSHVQ